MAFMICLNLSSEVAVRGGKYLSATVTAKEYKSVLLLTGFTGYFFHPVDLVF